MALSMGRFVHEEEETDHPRRYIPIDHLYSSTSPCINPSGSSNVMSKKVKARKLVPGFVVVKETSPGVVKEEPSFNMDFEMPGKPPQKKPLLVYRRRPKKASCCANSLVQQIPPELESSGVVKEVELEESNGGDQGGVIMVDDSIVSEKSGKKRKHLNNELLSLGAGSVVDYLLGRTRLRGSKTEGHNKCHSAGSGLKELKDEPSGLGRTKRWTVLNLEGVNPQDIVGLVCKVFWPMDDCWYTGSVTQYKSETKKHSVEYEDGDVEDLILSDEKIKFQISREEMQCLNLKCNITNTGKKGLIDDILALALSYNDCLEVEPGDIVWAKLTGHAMWPAVIMDEELVSARRFPKPIGADRTVVQFFGTHDFAGIKKKQVVPFLNGLLSSFHLKCKQTSFYLSLEEAKIYLSEHQLPNSMLQMQKGTEADDCNSTIVGDEEMSDSSEDPSDDEGAPELECVTACPFEIGDLRITSLGRIVSDSEFFHNKHYIWPEGYTASRKFISIADPAVRTCYKMEVLRNPKSKARPVFIVTWDGGETILGPNPTVCWKEIYSRIRKSLSGGFDSKVRDYELQKSGSYMFGFTNPTISMLIQGLPNSRSCSKYFEGHTDVPAGFRAVRIKWKDFDKCSVCHTDEEYEDNLFMQCGKCRMLVHARCYGEFEPLNGVLWLCNLCRPGAPKYPPPCCLCPVTGGAIKPTTDKRWAHLTCAVWIPETCLLDVNKMEPIDGLSRINKDRWKLLCSICGVQYGACIQCSNSTCRVAYHPLCARAAGLCVELEDENLIHLMSTDEDDDQCIRLLSFCKKHRQPSNEPSPVNEQLSLLAENCSTYIPPPNSSGCARSEPYNFFGRRGQKEPQVLAAASLKRLFVENRPHLVSGHLQNGALYSRTCNESGQKIKLRSLQCQTPCSIFSVAEKYKHMRETFRNRLAFGKSRIHGFGVFAKFAHRAGDMVIEYTGELVRPPIADIREHLIYNSLVGAGTYMFRIDDERVIDATRAGSIAHLINHSCEPNCYSRVISIHGNEHIIIFAKRDICEWEELTYDYRFFSKDVQLACYCGFPRCRGIVNDIETEEQMAKILAPRSELIPWSGD